MSVIVFRQQNPECAQRHLQIRTYKVMPMTTQVGIIEWVQNSITLLEFLEKGQTIAEESLAKSLLAANFKRYELMRKQMKIPDSKWACTYFLSCKPALLIVSLQINVRSKFT